MVNINVEVTDYANRVLNVFKAKNNLRTKEEALKHIHRRTWKRIY